MHITFDQLKREKALEERGLDFVDAAIVFKASPLSLKTLARIMANCESSVSVFLKGAWLLLDTHRVARIATFSV